MIFAVPSPRALVAMLGLMVVTTPVALGQQSLGYQGGATSLGGGVGQPLNLLSPTFVAPPPRPGSPWTGGAVPGAVQAPAAAAMMTAPLPLPRPSSAPQAVITQASAPAPAGASPVPSAAPQQTPAQAAPPPA
ncbi:MAG: 2-oxoglutarate dehydrogenase E2 component dihydrolipoamide succinyltransferase, partial [Xanthobacteraceae bacterium]